MRKVTRIAEGKRKFRFVRNTDTTGEVLAQVETETFLFANFASGFAIFAVCLVKSYRKICKGFRQARKANCISTNFG